MTGHLTMADLAERWQLPVNTVQQRRRQWGIPAINVGTDAKPMWRFRLPDLIRFEESRMQ